MLNTKLSTSCILNNYSFKECDIVDKRRVIENTTALTETVYE